MTTDPHRLCPGCFAVPATGECCTHCGHDPAEPRPVNALPLYSLLGDKFVIGRVLGKPGGFGITYLAFDRNLQTTVAIKEYLPRDLATRAADRTSIVVQSHQEQDLFDYGLEQFLTEARTLARLDHPNIVRVRDFFPANGSACLVMDYYPGQTLAQYLDRLPHGRMPEAQALALIQPVLDGLRAVHAEGILHRDIKPANIYLARTRGGGARPILLDFGAARFALGDRSRSLSVVLTPGYAPFEQYHRKGRQGPWTDVYAAAAVLYRMLTGEDPPEANERQDEDSLRPASAFGVSAATSDALSEALALRIDQRPQSVAAFQDRLQAPPRPPKPPKPPKPPEPPPGPGGWRQRLNHIAANIRDLRFLGVRDASWGWLLLVLPALLVVFSPAYWLGMVTTVMTTADVVDWGDTTSAGFPDAARWQGFFLIVAWLPVYLGVGWLLLQRAFLKFSAIGFSGIMGGTALAMCLTVPVILLVVHLLLLVGIKSEAMPTGLGYWMLLYLLVGIGSGIEENSQYAQYAVLSYIFITIAPAIGLLLGRSKSLIVRASLLLALTLQASLFMVLMESFIAQFVSADDKFNIWPLSLGLSLPVLISLPWLLFQVTAQFTDRRDWRLGVPIATLAIGAGVAVWRFFALVGT